jgi:hypothetical protein
MFRKPTRPLIHWFKAAPKVKNPNNILSKAPSPLPSPKGRWRFEIGAKRSSAIRTCTLALAAALCSLAASAAELLPPVPILAGGAPLDVEQVGHAAPFVADFDRDGVRDLLVGEFYKGRLRIYRNLGTNREPRFDRFTLFQNGNRAGCIHSSCCMGFGPQLIDFDGDGRLDILSGNWVFQVILFRGRADGSYAPGDPIKDKRDLPIYIGYGVTAFAADWDADGDLDLLGGTTDHTDQGNVYLVRNEGTAREPAFGEPAKLLADGLPISSIDGGAAPVAADWDRDGKLDLVLGNGDGSIRLYPNAGTPAAPRLAKFVELVGPSPRDGDRGLRSKPCVVDWNDDGYPDLVVGDVGKQFQKELNAEEEAWRKAARVEQQEYLKQWSRAFARYRELMAGTVNLPESARAEHQTRLAAARDEMARLNAVRARSHEQEEALKPGVQTHGRVWLFLNAQSQEKPVASN